MASGDEGTSQQAYGWWFLVVMSLLCAAIMVFEFYTPVLKDSPYDGAGERAKFAEVISIGLIPLIIYPILLAATFGRRPWTKAVALVLYGICVLIVCANLDLKEMSVHLPKTDLRDNVDYWVIDFVSLAIVIFLYLGGWILIHLMGAILLGVPGHIVRQRIAKKGYDFTSWQCGQMFYLIGPWRIKRLPSRDELGVIPGYGDGTCKEVRKLITEICRSRSV